MDFSIQIGFSSPTWILQSDLDFPIQSAMRTPHHKFSLVVTTAQCPSGWAVGFGFVFCSWSGQKEEAKRPTAVHSAVLNRDSWISWFPLVLSWRHTITSKGTTLTVLICAWIGKSDLDWQIRLGLTNPCWIVESIWIVESTWIGQSFPSWWGVGSWRGVGVQLELTSNENVTVTFENFLWIKNSHKCFSRSC